MPRADKIKRWTPEEIVTILEYFNSDENFKSYTFFNLRPLVSALTRRTAILASA